MVQAVWALLGARLESVHSIGVAPADVGAELLSLSCSHHLQEETSMGFLHPIQGESGAVRNSFV